MRLTVVGCSGSFAGPASPASCYLVRAEHEGRTWNVALDLGSGALGTLQQHVDPRELDAVVLTHLHPDHCIDLCGLYVMLRYHPDGPAAPLPVYGPSGTRTRISEAYGSDDERGVEGQFEFREHVAGEPVRIGPFTVTPYPVRHPVEAYGLRVEAGGHTVAYTGDTGECDTLLTLMADADLVLADSAFVEGRDTLSGIHLNGAQCARVATQAGGVGRLMLTHLPPWNDPEQCRAQAQEHWAGKVELAEPGATYLL